MTGASCLGVRKPRCRTLKELLPGIHQLGVKSWLSLSVLGFDQGTSAMYNVCLSTESEASGKEYRKHISALEAHSINPHT